LAEIESVVGVMAQKALDDAAAVDVVVDEEGGYGDTDSAPVGPLAWV
jgi:hypothetical protein